MQNMQKLVARESVSNVHSSGVEMQTDRMLDESMGEMHEDAMLDRYLAYLSPYLFWGLTSILALGLMLINF